MAVYNLGCTIDNNYVNKNNFILDKDKKTVAITFDDGPSMNNKIIADILAKNKANATFFVLGNKMNKDNVESLKYLLKKGNELGSHSYNHKILTNLKKNFLNDDFILTKNKFKELLNYDLKLVRPPYGIINNNIISNYDYSYILWNVDTLDWSSRSVSSVYKKVIGKVHDGDIILMHETYWSSVNALDSILPSLYQDGFQVTTVSNLAKLKGKNLANNMVYYNFK